MTPAKGLLEAACDRERVAIVYNPVSGTQDAAARRAALEALARDAGLTCELAETDRDHGAAPLARQAVADGMERLLVCGGDGSITEAAHALTGTGVALAVLPGGTGNLLALNLGLPTDLEAAVRLALTGPAQPIDVGRANGQVFLLMAGMGLDAHMVRDAGRKLKERLGVLAYFWAVLRNLGRRPVRYAITIDGHTLHRRAKMVLIANMGRITGGLELVPDSDPADGWLEIVILRAEGVGDLLALLARSLGGQLEDDRHLEVYRGREVRIETPIPQPVQLDGNEMPPTTRLHVRVEPRSLLVVRPPAGEAAAALPATPVAVLTHAAGAAWGLLAGAAATTALHLRARAAERFHRRPGFFSRHPVLTGLAAGVLTRFLTRGSTAEPTVDSTRRPGDTERNGE
jgi:diacylglycerol kinase (ATP)